MDYVGSKWYKCDLHLHTTQSKCFQDQAVTSEEWVKRAIAQGLHCIAVTDHNSGENINNIKIAAQETDLVIFPGVEITCDTSKIHLLILFDTTKSSVDIGDFLILCGIAREKFGEKDAFTSQSIFEVIEIANSKGALIIPAHIDDLNGLGSVSSQNLEKLFQLECINAVQVVHNEFLNSQAIDVPTLRTTINEYYNNSNPPIGDETITVWNKVVKSALKSHLSLLTFSDNPNGPKDSKHGLAGIGVQYTWIKMDQKPTLEGLRQAFLLPDFRIRNSFVCTQNPYAPPVLWIKSVTATNTSITGAEPLKIDFSPQLTTIIGGRGSGKSSLIRFIRGVFNRTAEIKELDDILKDHEDFYKRLDSVTKKGVLTENSIIEVEFVRNNLLYKIKSTDIRDSQSQTIEIHKLDATTNSWLPIEDEGFIDFFEYEHYSQKQIYEMAQETNALRKRIDKAIVGINSLEAQRDGIRLEYLEKSAIIRTSQQQIIGKGKVQTEIKDLDSSIKLLQNSGITELIHSKEQYETQHRTLSDFSIQLKAREALFDSIIHDITLDDIDYLEFAPDNLSELSQLSRETVSILLNIKAELEKLKTITAKAREAFEKSIINSSWNKAYKNNSEEFNRHKLQLEEQGIEDFSNFESLSKRKSDKERELTDLELVEQQLSSLIAERNLLQTKHLDACKEITRKRSEFISDVLKDEKVKILFKPFRNKTDFVNKFRSIIQRETRYENDIDVLSRIVLEGNVEQNIKKFREIIIKIRNNETVTEVSGRFINMIQRLSDAQIDEIEFLLPEDEIDVQYKQSGSTGFRPLSTASAGQKTTSILTFILSYGESPLILDQPEDDLDNKLVYELIVDRLKKAKEHRQIIVVTHNANIPVNGDSEYIVSMNSESNKLQTLHSGTVEQPHIKKEICDVMEGTEYAFQMRARRYKNIT